MIQIKNNYEAPVSSGAHLASILKPLCETPQLSRVSQMAAAMQDITAVHGGVQPEDLLCAGFNSAEIIEYQAEAAEIATGRSTRYIFPERHDLTDMAFKVRIADIDNPATPKNITLNDSQSSAWEAYCNSRKAYDHDQWMVLRERCMMQLLGYLIKLPLLPIDRNKLLASLEASLPKALNAKAGA